MIAKIALVLSTSGLAVLPLADGIPLLKETIDGAGELSRLGVAGILGLVALGSILAMLRQYKDNKAESKEHTDRLYKLIEKSTESATANTEAIKANTGILVEVKTQMIELKRK